jgi:hypothetical protein
MSIVVNTTHRVHLTTYSILLFAQLDQTHDFGDIRRATSASASVEWQTDYLVDACPCDTNAQFNPLPPWDRHGLRKLGLLAGNNRHVPSCLPFVCGTNFYWVWLIGVTLRSSARAQILLNGFSRVAGSEDTKASCGLSFGTNR